MPDRRDLRRRTVIDDELEQTSKTETITRHYDNGGKLISETTTVVTRVEPPSTDEPPTGMYL